VVYVEGVAMSMDQSMSQCLCIWMICGLCGGGCYVHGSEYVSMFTMASKTLSGRTVYHYVGYQLRLLCGCKSVLYCLSVGPFSDNKRFA
jgi:hypothetical protein